MKKILVDITHPAQLNFYLNIIKSLSKNYSVVVTVLGRGKLPSIADYELKNIPNVEIKVIGRKRNSKFSSIIEANLLRVFQLIIFVSRENIKLGFSNGFQASLAGSLFGFPVITFGDDPQSSDYYPKLLFTNKVYFCLYKRRFAKLNRHANILRCVKEWAYLSEDYFTSDYSVLEKYGVKEKEYIFIREVSTGTLNYSKQKNGFIAAIKDEIPKGFKVLFSLEDKSQRKNYPEEWILLEEPIQDFHSLIYFSKLLISSGDSMAREAAVMGLPGIYVGVRKMYANNVLQDLADFYHYDNTSNFNDFINPIINNSSIYRQKEIQKKLNSEFINVVTFINRITKKILK
ncbi:MAG: DUF354 domain-containing protein [Promethearchaeia archaeon]